MSKSAIYTVNSSAQNVAVNGIIDLGTVVRRFGNSFTLSGNGIRVCGGGYCDLDASFTLAPTAVGNVTITAFKDGVAIPGATATASVSTANNPVNISLSSMFREPCQCCDGCSSITFQLTGTAASVTNTAVVMEKL